MTQNSAPVTFPAQMSETLDYLENIVDILHAARQRDKKIGARLKHFYVSMEQIKVQLTGNGWVKTQKCIDGLAIFQEVNEALNRYGRATETWGSTHT